MTMSYGEQLKHPFWQRKRLEVLERDGWACKSCGTKTDTLHVHHRRYVKGRMAWEYPEHELVTLCEVCHDIEHGLRDLLDRLICEYAGPIPSSGLRVAIALLGGFGAGTQTLPDDIAAEARREIVPLFDAAVLMAFLGAHDALVSAARAIAPSEPDKWRDTLVAREDGAG